MLPLVRSARFPPYNPGSDSDGGETRGARQRPPAPPVLPCGDQVHGAEPPGDGSHHEGLREPRVHAEEVVGDRRTVR